MLRYRLTDEQWHLIWDFFPPYVFGRPPCDRRTVVDGSLWILRTGSPWRDLPDQFGPWQTVWRLFDRWNGDGTLDVILNQLRATAADAGELMMSCSVLMARAYVWPSVRPVEWKRGSGGTGRSRTWPQSRRINQQIPHSLRWIRLALALSCDRWTSPRFESI